MLSIHTSYTHTHTDTHLGDGRASVMFGTSTPEQLQELVESDVAWCRVRVRWPLSRDCMLTSVAVMPVEAQLIQEGRSRDQRDGRDLKA